MPGAGDCYRAAPMGHARGATALLSRRGVQILALMLVVGLGARLVVAFSSFGVGYDITSFASVRDALRTDPLAVYTTVNGDPFLRWPYLPGFFPVVVIAGWLGDNTGLPFHGWIQVAQIAADGAIAWLVQYYLGLRGFNERARLAGAGLVLLGPSFAVVSGYHGQIDQVAFLPGVLALVLWERSPAGVRRALIAGALIGLGTAIKTVPIVLLAAFLPACRDRREAGALIGTAVAVPLATLAPWLIADGEATLQSLRQHRALPGIGGISLLIQPELGKLWLSQVPVELSSLSRTLVDNQGPAVALLMAPVAALTMWRRLAPVHAAAILLLGMEVLGISFTFQYAVWALPFALMAGYLWQVAAVQAALVVPALLLYQRLSIGSPQRLYVPMMIVIWGALAVALTRMLYTVARTPRASSSATSLPSRTA